MAAQNAEDGDERSGGDGAEPAAYGVPPAEQQIGVGRTARHRSDQRGPQGAAEDEREAERARKPGQKLHPALREGNALRLHQAALGFVDGGHAALCDLTGQLVHRSHPAQMGRAGGHVAHLADLGRAGTGKNAVGQYIYMKFPQMEAARHDLHGLLHPEHLCAVFQQGLPCGHDKIHDAAAQLFIGKRVSAVHCLLSLQKMIPYFIMCTSRIQGRIIKSSGNTRAFLRKGSEYVIIILSLKSDRKVLHIRQAVGSHFRKEVRTCLLL